MMFLVRKKVKHSYVSDYEYNLISLQTSVNMIVFTIGFSQELKHLRVMNLI